MFDQSSDLYARLSVVAYRRWLPCYTGTISASGQFELTSLILALSGCENPRIEGGFNRQMDFTPCQSCDSQLRPATADLRGVSSLV